MTHATAGRGANAHAASSTAWIAATLVLAAAALVLIFFVLPHALSADGYVRFVKLDTLLRGHVLTPERYSYVGPLFASPFWLLGDSRVWWCARFNALVLAAGSIVSWRLARGVLIAEEPASFVLLIVATGMMPNATRDFFGEMFSAILTGTGLLLVTARHRSWGWCAVVLGVANIPAWAAGLCAAAIWRAVRARRADGLLALGCAGALIVLENWVVRGHPFAAGYEGDRGFVTVMPFSGMPGFSYPLILGLVSLLFSFGKGLLFFAPALLLIAHARRVRPEARSFLDLSVAFLVGLLFVYARWWAWYGGWTWGPRYLLFAAYPSSLALAIALHTSRGSARSLATATIACWTVWVGVSGAAFGLEGLGECLANNYALEYLCWYVPEFSPLFRPFALRPPSPAAWQVSWMILAAVVLAVLVTPALASMVRQLRARAGGAVSGSAA